MIQSSALSFSYKEVGFQFPDINCLASDSLVITGQSGVGKTTLLHLLAGIIKPESGKIFIDSQNICDLSGQKLDKFRGKNIGLILQQPHFIEALTVRENLIFSAWLSTNKKLNAEADFLLNELGIFQQKDKLPTQLSVGQQQRLSIARALMAGPRVLLADEPTSSLDDENTAIVASLLQNLSQKFESALIVVTHDERLKQIFPNHINLRK